MLGHSVNTDLWVVTTLLLSVIVSESIIVLVGISDLHSVDSVLGVRVLVNNVLVFENSIRFLMLGNILDVLRELGQQVLVLVLVNSLFEETIVFHNINWYCWLAIHLLEDVWDEDTVSLP
jgi:hypothetical protein